MMRRLLIFIVSTAFYISGVAVADAAEQPHWRELRSLEPVVSIDVARADPLAVISLHIKNRSLSDDDIDVIASLKNLQMLLLNHNELKEFDDRLLGLTKLRVLDLSYNQLNRLPDGFAALGTIEAIALFKNQFTRLPLVIAELRVLKSIYLGQNMRLDVAQSIDVLSGLTNLQYLGFGGLRQKTLPKSIESLRKLEDLFLAGNAFDRFPESLLSLTNLRYLTLSNNQITRIPEDIGRLGKLKALIMKNNPLIAVETEYPFELIR